MNEFMLKVIQVFLLLVFAMSICWSIRMLMFWRRLRQLKSKDREIRRQAAEKLGKWGDVRAAEPLIRALDDEDHNVRKAAAQALGNIEHREVAEPLIRALNDESHNVRKAAAQVLGNIKYWGAAESLIKVLNDEDPNVRKAAARALAVIGDTRAVAPLIRVLQDQRPDVSMAVAEALMQFRSTKTANALVEALGLVEALREELSALREERSYRQPAVARALELLGWQPANDMQRALQAVAFGTWEQASVQDISSLICWLPLILCAYKRKASTSYTEEFFAKLPFEEALPYLLQALRSDIWVEGEQLSKRVLRESSETIEDWGGSWNGSWEGYRESIVRSVEYTFVIRSPIAEGAKQSLEQLAKLQPSLRARIEENLRQYESRSRRTVTRTVEEKELGPVHVTRHEYDGK